MPDASDIRVAFAAPNKVDRKRARLDELRTWRQALHRNAASTKTTANRGKAVSSNSKASARWRHKGMAPSSAKAASACVLPS